MFVESIWLLLQEYSLRKFFKIFLKPKDWSLTERPEVIPFLHNADKHNMFVKVMPNKNSVGEPILVMLAHFYSRCFLL